MIAQCRLPLALLGEAGPIHKFFTLDPALSGWILLPGMVLVVALIYYLYRAQQRIASARLVGWLTGIRIALIVLLFALLLRPLWVWTHTEKTSETLWVVVDQSLSMAQKDAHAAPAERLRWADALGFLPPNSRPSKLDRSAALSSALRDDIFDLRHQATLAGEEQDAPQRIESLVSALKDWSGHVTDVAASIEKDPHSDAYPVAKDLRDIAKAASDGAAVASTRTRLEDATADVPWPRLSAALDNAALRLRSVADKADEEFLRQHGNDAPVKEAMEKVATLRRADLAYAALTGGTGGGSLLKDVLDRQNTRVVSFGSTQQLMAGDDKKQLPSALKTALEPAGSATDLAGALGFVADQVSDGEKASVLVVSDGRVNAGGDPAEPARRLASRGVRVFTLAVGAIAPAPDAAVESIDAPDWIYKDDTLRASALLRLDGLAGKPIKVEFRRGKELIDTQTITPASNQATQVVTFKDKPPQADVYPYQVNILPVPGEAVTDNNKQTVRVAVKKDKLQALVIEDQPRWEYRYLVNYLKRDNRVHVQSVLLEPARVDKIAPPPPTKASPMNDSDEAQQLPATAEEWSAFDMVVLGDCPPEFLTPETQKNIAKAVRDRGTTLLVIAGPLNMPSRYAGTPLADALPVQLSSDWSNADLADHLRNGFRPVVAPEGAGSILSQFGLDESSNGRYWSQMPAWFWHSEQTSAKTAASVLWRIGDLRQAPDRSADNDTLAAARQKALLATMPLGMGRVMYLASDSTWRLRQVNGENLHERFWGQVIRWVAGNDMPAGGKFVRFGADKPRYIAGENVRVTARVLKEDFTPLAGQKFKVVARSIGENGKGVGQPRAEAEMKDSPESPGLYRADLRNLPEGPVELSLQGQSVEALLDKDAQAAQKTLQVDVQSQANVEHQNINADRATLARAAREGNGVALDANYADVLASRIPNLEHEQTSTQQFGMFADPNGKYTRAAHWGFLALFVTLITAEWILRKAGGLV